MRDRVESFIRERGLIEPRGEVTVLVSGGADSTCLWHVLGQLGYRVSAVHVAHGLRGDESDEDACFCRDVLGADVVDASCSEQLTEAALRDRRYGLTADCGLRATGHTASDQVESVLLGLVASGSPQRIKSCREDGVVRPLLGVWREETRAYCEEHGLAYRDDSLNPDTKRGLIRDEILPLLERLDPRTRASLLSLGEERPRLPRTLERTLAELLATRDGTKAADLGAGVRPSGSTEHCGSRARSSGGHGRSSRSAPVSRCAAAGRATASRAAARKCRICSWTRRCPGRSATAGRSWSRATRSSPCRVSPRHRGGKER